MWWTLLISLVFLQPLVEMIEECRLSRSAKRDLNKIRKHVEQHHRWDITRGGWVA